MGKGIEMVGLTLSEVFQLSQLREEDEEKARFMKRPQPLVSMRSEENVVHLHLETFSGHLVDLVFFESDFIHQKSIESEPLEGG